MLRLSLPVAAFMLLAMPAFAGNVNFSNGKGMWQSTMCQRPIPPTFVGLGPEAPAESLNAATAHYNLFVKQTQDYLACISAEAKADSEGTAGLIMDSAQHQMQDAQAEADRARGQITGPQR